MHNRHISKTGLWPRSIVPTPGLMRRLDQVASESINGDDGGSWSPASPIVIGGTGGMVLFGTGQLGDVTTRPAVSGRGKLTLSDSDYPTFTTPITRTEVMGLRDFFSRRDKMDPGDGTNSGASAYYAYDESSPGGIINQGSPLRTFNPNDTHLLCPIPHTHLIDGATIAAVTLTYRLVSAPNVVPPIMPGFRILRVGPDGAYLNALSEIYQIPTRTSVFAYSVGDLMIPTAQNGKQYRCTVAGTTASVPPTSALNAAAIGATVTDGTVTWKAESGPSAVSGHYCRLPRPSSIAGYYNGGQPQQIVMSTQPSLINNTVDFSSFAYWLQVYDPGPTSGWDTVYHSLKIDLSNVTVLRPKA